MSGEVLIVGRGFAAAARAIGAAVQSIDAHDVAFYGGTLAVGYGAAMTFGEGVGLMVGGGILVSWAWLPALRFLFSGR